MKLLFDLSLLTLVAVCLLMTLLILMQKPKQEGLGAAFGGGMTNDMFGAHTVTVLQKGTVYLAIAFFLLTAVVAWSGVRLDKETEDSGNYEGLGAAVESSAPTAAETSAEETPGLTIPPAEETPAAESTPAGETAPGIEEAPVTEEAPATQEAPALEESPATEAPAETAVPAAA